MRFSKEFLGLQVNFALKASQVTEEPQGLALGKYTGLSRNFDIPFPSQPAESPVWKEYLDILSNAPDIVEATYAFYQARQKQPSSLEERTKFGCFYCEAQNKGTLVRIHFNPKEDENGLGPLNKVNRKKRLKELKGLFEFAKANFPLATTVGGFSWLYNIPAYASLFPPEYAQSGKPKEWYASLAIWGQFLKNSGEVRPEIVVPFTSAIARADSWDQLSQSFKYKPLETRCPITNFYDFYGLG